MSRFDEIKDLLRKQATWLTTGGRRPIDSLSENWIGKVNLYKADEAIPTDANGEMMIPLLQLHLDTMPYVPDVLKGTKVITMFISCTNMPTSHSINDGKSWLLREYKDGDELVKKDLSNENSKIKPFQLNPQLLDEDYPSWDSPDIPDTIVDELCAMEESGEISDYLDYCDCEEGHKLGGYPSYIQSGTDFGEGFEFAIQIASDTRCNFNIVDNGNFYLAKNKVTGQWKLHLDFF